MPDSDRYRRGLVGRSAPSSEDHWTDGLDGVPLPVDGKHAQDPARARRRRARLTAARQERKRRRADEALWRQPLCTR